MESSKTAMSATERKRKSSEKQLEKVSEKEKQNFKEKERKRVKKAIQNMQIKQQEQMTSAELKGFRKTEVAHIKALRNKSKALLAKQTEN